MSRCFSCSVIITFSTSDHQIHHPLIIIGTSENVWMACPELFVLPPQRNSLDRDRLPAKSLDSLARSVARLFACSQQTLSLKLAAILSRDQATRVLHGEENCCLAVGRLAKMVFLLLELFSFSHYFIL